VLRGADCLAEGPGQSRGVAGAVGVPVELRHHTCQRCRAVGQGSLAQERLSRG
jgi:hypothetical protein